jgi:hypothetical protein
MIYDGSSSLLSLCVCVLSLHPRLSEQHDASSERLQNLKNRDWSNDILISLHFHLVHGPQAAVHKFSYLRDGRGLALSTG